jgi:hypothetical protein
MASIQQLNGRQQQSSMPFVVFRRALSRAINEFAHPKHRRFVLVQNHNMSPCRIVVLRFLCCDEVAGSILHRFGDARQHRAVVSSALVLVSVSTHIGQPGLLRSPVQGEKVCSYVEMQLKLERSGARRSSRRVAVVLYDGAALGTTCVIH